MDFADIGLGSFVSANRIVAIASPDSAPVRRMIQNAREQKVIIDATYGRKTRSLIVTDSGYIVLSSLQKETISRRLDKG